MILNTPKVSTSKTPSALPQFSVCGGKGTYLHKHGLPKEPWGQRLVDHISAWKSVPYTEDTCSRIDYTKSQVRDLCEDKVQ